ncbi:MAG: peptidylprolyl isomerase [Planctomycetales bacterium]|nr:peptidylprolyl isomerase [Planctomycetales bacterium]
MPIQISVLIGILLGGLSLGAPRAIAQQTYGPSDPIASIKGDPILLGELNYLLISKLGAKDLSSVNIDVQRASSALLVRQHQAMKTLREQGGENLQLLLDQDWNAFVEGLKRTGKSVDEFCKERKTNEKSVRASRDWDSAWRRYLKSRMTDANLKRYYQLHADKFASARWNVSHLFLPVDKENRDSADLAEYRMLDILDQLRSVSSDPQRLAARFAELAKKESDGATAKDGGKIGWVSAPGDLPESVMDAIRKTDENSVSAITRSPLGYHLVLVHEKMLNQIPFEQLTDLSPLRREAANVLFEALVTQQNGVPATWYIKSLQPPGQPSDTEASGQLP